MEDTRRDLILMNPLRPYNYLYGKIKGTVQGPFLGALRPDPDFGDFIFVLNSDEHLKVLDGLSS